MQRWLGALLVTLGVCVTATAQPIEGEKAREAWQRVPDLIATLNIGAGSTVADVGAGYGFLTVRLAPIVGTGGRVFAVDASASPLEQLRRRMADEHLENVSVVEGDQHDPHLPAGALDAVAILNAYHEFTFVDEMLQHLRQALKPGGRLVTLEPVPRPTEQTPEQQKAAHVISPERVVDELQRAGFTIVRRDDQFVKHPDTGGYYALIVSERPRAPQASAGGELSSLRFLLGEWEAIGAPAGETGGFTFALGVQDRVMTRTNYAIYDARHGRPASRHDDLMVMYSEDGVLKADYFDSEQHVIRNIVQTRGDREVVFVSEAKPSEARYRLTDTARADGTLAGQFEIAAPGTPDAFKPYLSWRARTSHGQLTVTRCEAEPPSLLRQTTHLLRNHFRK